MQTLKLTLTGLFFLTTTCAYSQVFTYSLEGFPKQERQCYLQAKFVGSLFESGTKAKVTHVECTHESSTGYDFSIEYEANEKLSFTTTDYTIAGVYPRPRYKKQSDCEQNLPNQIELFKSATKLNPIFTYCKMEDIPSSIPWEVIITAPGKSALQPQIGGFLIFTNPQKTSLEEISNNLRMTLAKKGAIFADLVFHPRFPMAEASIHYFADKRFDFSLEATTKVPKLEICLDQATEVSRWFETFDIKPFSIFCGGPIFGEYELNIGNIDYPNFSHKESVEKFDTFDECEKNKIEVLEHYSGSSAKTVGGLCSRDIDTNRYHVVVFRQNNF